MKTNLFTAAFFFSVVLLGGAVVNADDTKAIWGTDGAAITKDGVPAKPVSPPVVKPVVPIKKVPQEVVTDPVIVKPGTVAD